MQIIDISHSKEIYTVTQLNHDVRFLLEGSFPLLWVEGEISNFIVPQSGHWYFSLKDSAAQVRCAMFRQQNKQLDFVPKEGMHLLVKARVSLYEGRGDFQLLIEHMEAAGEGKLRQAFERLKKRLAEAGLFSAAHKKPLPPLPKTIGIITSPTGAAIHDILTVLARRYAYAHIIIYPTLVQGEMAAAQIVQAIQVANQRAECDVLILARGGGSLEDLWPFNEEKVAYAIYHSQIPIVSGVGHEVDFTMADWVADVRAPTPSAAAELIAPHQQALLAGLQGNENRLLQIMQQKLKRWQQNLLWLEKQIRQQHPKRRLVQQMQRLDFLEITLVRLQQQYLAKHNAQLHLYQTRINSLKPSLHIDHLQQQLQHQQKSLVALLKKALQKQQDGLGYLSAKLHALSPLAVLQRGFAIVTDKKHTVIRQATAVQPKDMIRVQLQVGSLNCSVEKIENGT